MSEQDPMDINERRKYIHKMWGRYREAGRTGKGKLLDEMEQVRADIVQTALQKGIRFGSIHLADSTHSTADVNPAKESQQEKKGKGPIDPDAQWGAKGKHTTAGWKRQAYNPLFACMAAGRKRRMPIRRSG